MQRLIQSVAPVRDMLYKRAVGKFVEQQKGLGMEIDDAQTVEALGTARTIVLDAEMLLEGDEHVRGACAPFALCPVERLKRQPSWMMLAAGVALGCADYAPLERFAEALSFAPERMARQYPRVERIAYDDARGIETTIHREGSGLRAYAKGAPGAVLKRCLKVQEGKERPLLDFERAKVMDAARRIEREGLQALAFAMKPLDETAAEPETEMTFLGMVAVGDAPNGEAPRYVHSLGALMRPVLMSARTLPEGVLRATGLVRPQAGVLTGAQATLMDGAALVSACDACDAFVGMDEVQRARVAAALRAGSGADVVALGEAACGDVRVSLKGGEGDVRLHGGPEMLASLIRTSRVFLETNGKIGG